MGKKAPTTEAAATQTSPAPGLELLHANDHADLIKSPNSIDGWHQLMHVFLDTQPPSLAAASIATLKQAGIYGEAIKKSRHHFDGEGEPSDFAKGFGQALSLAHSIIVTMVRAEAESVVAAVKDAPPEVKVAAYTEAFMTTVKGGMIASALTHAADRAYKLKGAVANVNAAQRNNIEHVVHVLGMPLAELIVAETTVPEGTSIN